MVWVEVPKVKVIFEVTHSYILLVFVFPFCAPDRTASRTKPLRKYPKWLFCLFYWCIIQLAHECWKYCRSLMVSKWNSSIILFLCERQAQITTPVKWLQPQISWSEASYTSGFLCRLPLRPTFTVAPAFCAFLMFNWCCLYVLLSSSSFHITEPNNGWPDPSFFDFSDSGDVLFYFFWNLM